MGRIFRTVCDPACRMHCMISKHNGWFLQLMEKGNVKQSRLSVSVFILEKKNQTTLQKSNYLFLDITMDR